MLDLVGFVGSGRNRQFLVCSHTKPKRALGITEFPFSRAPNLDDESFELNRTDLFRIEQPYWHAECATTRVHIHLGTSPREVI